MIGYGKSQNKVYDWLKIHRAWATSKEVGAAFGKNTKGAYRVLSSLENAYRVAATTDYPIRWNVI